MLDNDEDRGNLEVENISWLCLAFYCALASIYKRLTLFVKIALLDQHCPGIIDISRKKG